MVGEDAHGPGFLKRIKLKLRILIGGRNPRVPDDCQRPLPVSLSRRDPGFDTTGYETGFQDSRLRRCAWKHVWENEMSQSHQRCAWAVSAQQCCTLCVVDDLEPLTDAERKLLEAVQTSGLCDLSQDDETDRTVRAAVLKAILSGEGEAWGIGAGAAINLRGAVVSGDLGGFDGSRLPPIRLESCRFEDSVDFSGATFTGDAEFHRATFTGDAWFDGATFTGAAGFHKATFTGDAGFDEATFTGDARFDEATFTGDAGFNKATFTGDAGSTRRPSPATPGSARRPSPATPGSRGDLHRRRPVRRGDLHRRRLVQQGDLHRRRQVRRGDFHRRRPVRRATFTGDASFDKATFTGTAWFTEATFTGTPGSTGRWLTD